MNNFLLLTCISLGMIVFIGFFNEKITHLTNEIALMLFATILGFVITVVWSSLRHMTVQELLASVRVFNPEKFLLHGVLCFMLFAVSLSYLLCEAAHCSGALACVVAGVCFSTLQERTASGKKDSDGKQFDEFWETLDVFFNSVLYVMLGLTFVRVLQINRITGLLIIAIALNLISRFCSLYIGTWLMGSLPDGYDRFAFAALYTWSGLRGGLSIALAMSAANLLPEQSYFLLLGCTYAIVFIHNYRTRTDCKTCLQSLECGKVLGGTDAKKGLQPLECGKVLGGTNEGTNAKKDLFDFDVDSDYDTDPCQCIC